MSEFYKNTKASSGYRSTCKACDKIRNANYYSKNSETLRLSPSEARSRSLWTNYRMTLEEYEALSINGCHACGSFDRLHVDHNHECCPGKKSCGKCVRGVLCQGCNIAEGMLNSDANRALALAAYILSSSKMVINK